MSAYCILSSFCLLALAPLIVFFSMADEPFKDALQKFGAAAWNSKMEMMLSASTKDATLKSEADALVDSLLTNDLAYTEWLTAEKVCPHVNNPKQDLDKVQATISSCGGTLGDIKPHGIRAFTVSCSHTMAWIWAVESGASPTADSVEYAINGKLSKDRLCELSPSMSQPFEKGLPFVIVRHEVASACPMIAAFLQEAGNVGNRIRKDPSIMQVLFQLHARAVTNTKLQGKPNWDGIAKQLDSFRPDLAGQMSNLCKFVENWAGGADPIHLKDLDTFGKQLKFQRDLSPATLVLFKDLPFAKMPSWIFMCLKACQSAPENFVVKGECKLFNSVDTQAMTGNLMPHITEAVARYTKGRDWLASLGVDEGAIVKHSGEFAMQLVMHVCSKRSKSRKQFKSIDEICDDFVRCVADVVKDPKVKAPWQSESSDNGKSGAAFREFSGNAFDPSSLAAMGFVPKVHVTTSSRKGETCKLDSVGAECVLVLVNDSGRIPVKLKVSAADLADSWSIMQPEHKVVAQTKDLQSPHDHSDSLAECTKAVAKLALEKAFIEHQSVAYNGGGDTGFEVQLKPQRSVFTKSAYAKGKLVLVPFSTSVSALSKDGPNGSVCLGCPRDASGKVQAFVSQRCDYAHGETVSGCHSKEVVPFVAPFWCVKPEGDSASANMQVSHIRILVGAGSSLSDGGDAFVDVPVLTNKSSLKAGDELRVFDQDRAALSKAKTKKRGVDASGGTAKRHRQAV
ncbi:unnamed protein product [Prorocentrum cordatum]|uniref:FACT complex subunit n=1 Tax=Prorocentrum cordatum TaxID=2364126 RepID=A0ABN9V748_9DINO|nr:unnamed protein product [Polarella glacialis]